MTVITLKNKNYQSTLTAPFDIDLGGMIPLMTTTLSSTASSVTFTSIPSNYEHLQVRITARDNRGVNNGNPFNMQFNSDTASNYSSHALYGSGTTSSVVGYTSVTTINTPYLTSANDAANVFASFVIDILDYTNSNKHKVVRGLSGYDLNGSGGYVVFHTAAWRNTSPITSINFYPNGSASMISGSSFALYGIKRAGA